VAPTRLLWKVLKDADETIVHPVDLCILKTWGPDSKSLAFTNYVSSKTGYSRRTVRNRFYRLEKLGFVERYMDKRTFTQSNGEINDDRKSLR
jgi:DNA-binding transcriptional regulator YhcF (GntR family)